MSQYVLCYASTGLERPYTDLWFVIRHKYEHKTQEINSKPFSITPRHTNSNIKRVIDINVGKLSLKMKPVCIFGINL